MSECSVCLGECQKDIHSATVRVHRWWRQHLLTGLSVARDNRVNGRKTEATIAQVGQLLKAGKTKKEIASQLGASIPTIKGMIKKWKERGER